MVLVDSSVWIRVQRRRASLADSIPADEEAALCPVVFMEVLRGSRTETYGVVREMLTSAAMLDDPVPLERFEEAARIYMNCRSAGVTPSAMDCLVAACAIAHDVPLVHDDGDFVHIARVIPALQLV